VALLRVDLFSDTLGLSTSMTVILPQPTTTQIGMGRRADDRLPLRGESASD
jgi:putative tributyrin esterase